MFRIYISNCKKSKIFKKNIILIPLQSNISKKHRELRILRERYRAELVSYFVPLILKVGHN